MVPCLGEDGAGTAANVLNPGMIGPDEGDPAQDHGGSGGDRYESADRPKTMREDPTTLRIARCVRAP